MNETVADLGERALIDRIRARVPPAPDWVEVGIGDDAAVLAPQRNALEVLTTDALVEGVHFDRAFVPARAIGHRAMAANLSDLAAMGASPRAGVLSLALPDALPLSEFDDVVDGALTIAGRHGLSLVGGNIARSPGPLVVDITVVGTARPRRVMRRSGARPGHVLYVSGTIGAAGAGLEWCRDNRSEALATRSEHLRDWAARFLYPEPRVRLGSILARTRAASACVDLSDGLADGVHQLAAASGFGAIVDGGAVPVESDVAAWFSRSGRDPLLAALVGGEDYELLFTLPARHHRLLQAVERAAAGVPLTRIGVITREPRVVLRRDGRDDGLPRGFTHFR